MYRLRIGYAIGIIMIARAGCSDVQASENPPDNAEPLIINVLHPERQGAEVLRLFEGSRAASPAAALSAWKRSVGNGGQLGKPLEAVIAMFNPEMVRESRVLDGSEVQIGFDPDGGSPRWFAIVPHDDGTLASALTAAHLSYPDDEPLREAGLETAVARLTGSGRPLASQVGSGIILASSRAELIRGIRAVPRASTNPDKRGTTDASGARLPPTSGLAFRLDPRQLASPRGGSLSVRRIVEAIHSSECRGVEGILALHDGCLTFEASTTRAPVEGKPGPKSRLPAIDSRWLARLPASDVMAFLSVALDPTPANWDKAFALADRVERVDPSHAGGAPLRTRMNLMAAAAGVKPEADLLPHLRGVSACAWGDPREPGRLAGVLLMLHLDEEPSARRLAEDFLPRLVSLFAGRPALKSALRGPGLAAPRTGESPGESRRLGPVLGRMVTIWWLDRDVMMAWGDDALAASLQSPIPPGRSLVSVYRIPPYGGRGAPQRFGAFWPGRLWRPGKHSQFSPENIREIAIGPPIVWHGWNERDRAYDLVRWPELSVRVRHLLEKLPPSPPRNP